LGGAVVFALLLTAAVLGGGYVVVARRFHQTPEYQWRKRVFEHSTFLAEQRRRLVAQAPKSPELVLDEERRRAKEAALTAVPLEQLIDHSGIGPGTVGLLRESGITNIPAILRANLGAISGIGRQKASLLWSASRVIIAECDVAFDAERSPQGIDFAERAPLIRDAARRALDEYSKALASIDAAISAHHGSERIASKITLIGYLRNRMIVGLDAERMRRPISTPDVRARSLAAAPSSNGDLLQELLQESVPLPKVEPTRRHPQQDRLEAFARFGAMIALADGRAAQAELRLVRSFLAELFGHEPDLLRRIDPLVELCVVAKPFIDHTIAEANRVAAGEAELSRLYQWAAQITDASSGRNDRESALLDRIAKEWNLAAPSPQSEALAVASPASSIAPAAAVPPTDLRTELGIPADAEITVELVRRRYSLVVDQLDAARLDGLGEEFASLAALKREKVEAAALALLHPFGATLAPPQAPPPSNDLRHNPDLDAVFGA
jgi:hypothetical protein